MKQTLRVIGLILEYGSMTNVQIAEKLDTTCKLSWQCLKQMHHGGSVKFEMRDGERFWYVDKDCKLPQGVTHAQVLEMWA